MTNEKIPTFADNYGQQYKYPNAESIETVLNLDCILNQVDFELVGQRTTTYLNVEKPDGKKVWIFTQSSVIQKQVEKVNDVNTPSLPCKITVRKVKNYYTLS